MGGGSVLVGKSKNYEVFIGYSSPDERKHIRRFSFRKKGEENISAILEDDLCTEENQRMLDEFEEQQTRMRDAETLESLFPIIDREKLTLAEIYQRMVKAENLLVIWKKRAEEAEGILFEIAEFHERLANCEHDWEATDNQGHSMTCNICGMNWAFGGN